MRVVEHRTSSHAKLIITILAVEKLLFGFKLDSFLVAARALRAIGPTKPHKKLSTFLISWEHTANVHQIHKAPLMEKGRKKILKKVPTRKLIESIKQDLRKTIKEAKAPKKTKK